MWYYRTTSVIAAVGWKQYGKSIIKQLKPLYKIGTYTICKHGTPFDEKTNSAYTDYADFISQQYYNNMYIAAINCKSFKE